jgi:hypothetical protein
MGERLMNSKISLSLELFIMDTMEKNIIDFNSNDWCGINYKMASISDYTCCQMNRAK